MDIIYLNQLSVDTTIGIYAWERQLKQTIMLDLELGCNISRAAKRDNIDDALDYQAISDRIISFVSHSEFQLIETLAEQIAGIILTEFNVCWLRLSLNKQYALKAVTDVGVIIERGQRE